MTLLSFQAKCGRILDVMNSPLGRIHILFRFLTSGSVHCLLIRASSIDVLDSLAVLADSCDLCFQRHGDTLYVF